MAHDNRTATTPKSHKKKGYKNMANVIDMPPQEGQTEAEPPQSPAPESAPTAPRKPFNKGGRPKNGTPPPIDPAFFKKVAAIPSEDWGTRAFMYVYIDEPVCVEKTWGQYSYALKCKQPMLDLEPLKERYGSHKGWLSLNTRKSGKDATDQIDRYDYEIFDPLAPPKIPRAAWANDQRNDRWRSILPPEPPTASAAAASFTDAINIYKGIRDEVRDEMPVAEAPSTVRETLETIKAAKDLLAPAATAPAASIDPFDTAKKIMDMRTNDPMIQLLLQRMDAQDKAAEAGREREFKLQQQLLEAKNAAPASATPPTGIIEQLINFGGDAIKERIVGALFGGAKTAAEAAAPARTGKMGTLDFLAEVLPRLFESPLANAAAAKLMTSTATNPAAPMSATGAVQHQPQNGSDPFQRFIADIVTPKMLMYFDIEPGKDGGESFADWIYAGFPEHFQRLQNFQHPMLPGLQGAAAILTAYKNTPSVWARVSTREQQFAEFVNGFCAWSPEPAEPEPPASGEPIDLDTEMESRPS